MPLYEYRCEACEHQFEVIQRFSDDPITVCPACGLEPVIKLPSSPAIQFKGTGWYITDYARKGGGGPAGGTSASTAKTEGGDAAAKPADGAAASKSDSKPAESPKKD
jgi:putative FmdB family regulatory protein